MTPSLKLAAPTSLDMSSALQSADWRGRLSCPITPPMVRGALRNSTSAFLAYLDSMAEGEERAIANLAGPSIIPTSRTLIEAAFIAQAEMNGFPRLPGRIPEVDFLKTGNERAGFGISKLTPTRSLELAGIAGSRKGAKTLDDLRVRAISVTSGETSLVLVSVDALYISRKFCDELGGWLQDTYGIPSDNLMAAATHTHCAPLLLDRYFENVKADEEFFETADAATRSSIRQAMDSRTEAAIEFSSDTAQVSIHRRARRLDRVAARRFRPRMTMANRPNRRGPVDNTVRVIRFRMKTRDQTDIVLISVGCHPSG